MPFPSIAERLAQRDAPTFSFEYFPPADDAGIQQLIGTVDQLSPLRPDWVSVTYGATGASRYRTFSAVGAIRGQTAARTMGHLTVAGQDEGEIRRAIEAYERLGVTQILALRGDPPGGGAYEPRSDGLATATDLVRLIRSMGDFSVGVAAFPAGHPESDLDLDARILLDKQEAGAEFAVTQLFFDAEAYFALVERFRALGGTIPIVAGIMPVTVPSQIERFATMSGARMPAAFEAKLRAVADDRDRFRAVGLELMTALCDDVLAGGAPGLQFFTLNRSKATQEILARLREMPARVPA
ncbi:5,10-methylenetetrahydrofolate reductase [Propioniciclava coleopterorum]|uniref:Methylenetetrahydrofolate reductase n=1 Tax=Propioniciclava coleopterorum TaxID=2714937 RepID=A0A6G7Y836_9ACTN|nr:methylenetetrahydrofolate reductase [Propioniciclava coleopterorum]QIK72940.1 5,10-methylenetetrahydrofolate reductase [Propioniciclava coleopterorum]